MEASLFHDGSLWDAGLLLVGAAGLLLLAKQHGRKPAAERLPPGPRNWPIVGALFEMEVKMQRAFDRLVKKYGPIVYFRLGIQDVVVVSDGEAARELLRDKDSRFTNRNTLLTKTAGKYTGFNGASFVFADYNEQLKQTRKICYAEFFCLPKMKASENIRSREVTTMIEKIARAANVNDSKGREPVSVDMRHAIMHMNTNVIFEYVFGRNQDSLPENDHLRGMVSLLERYLALFMSFPMADLFPVMKWLDPQGTLKVFKKFGEEHENFFVKVLEDQRKLRAVSKLREDAVDRDSSANLIDVLLDFQESGGGMSDEGIMAAISAIVVGGMDTSSVTVEWALLELVKHPHLMARLQAEVDHVVGRDRMLKESDVASMPFLNAVLTETMRLHPAVNFTGAHVNGTPETLGGYHIPANTAVFVNMYSIGRDPKVWENPTKFNPDRFMPSESSYDPALISVPTRVHGGNFNLVPFGAGRRSCLGYSLGIAMVLRTIGSVVHAFDLNPPPGTTAEDISTEDKGSITSMPASKLSIVPKLRLPGNVYNATLF